MTTAVPLTDIVRFLNIELQIGSYSDLAYNGLQIEASQADITRVAFAVDAGTSVARQAIERGCQLLIVHHGVMWGKLDPIVGPWARKLELFLRSGLSLYAAHLPLDGHPIHGNAAQIAKLLGANQIESAFEHKGSPIGVTAQLPRPMTADDIAATLSSCEGALTPPLLLPFGSTKIKSVGIATGSATSVIPEVAMRGLDLLITGEPKQEAYHTAREYQCSVICMGHYASETFGVRALERVLAERFHVNTEWISEPTGI